MSSTCGEPESSPKHPSEPADPGGEASRWKRITELVGDAWNMGLAERAAFLGKECDHDSTLLAEVQALLSEQESLSDFLECDVLEDRLPKGTKLGSYIIEDKIGEGGMGVVYRGRDDRMGRIVAIKVVRFLGVPAQGHREQILHEARTTAALNHPNIVTIYDVGSTAGNDFIVMEYVEGKTLDKFFRDGNTLQLAEALRIGEQVARALAHAHSKRIIHRDLKPGNIIVTENHGAKVLDFGLAKQLSQIT